MSETHEAYEDIEPFTCTPEELARAAYDLGMDHFKQAMEHLEEAAGCWNKRIEYERRERGGWARITMRPNDDPATQIPCGVCGGAGTLDGEPCPPCDGRGLVHAKMKFHATRVEDES